MILLLKSSSATCFLYLVCHRWSPDMKPLFQHLTTSSVIKLSLSALSLSILSRLPVYIPPFPSSLALITLQLPFPDDSSPVSCRLLRRSGHLGCYTQRNATFQLSASPSLVSVNNSSINSTWAVANKLHKHSRRISSVSLALTDLAVGWEMMETVGSWWTEKVTSYVLVYRHAV